MTEDLFAGLDDNTIPVHNKGGLENELFPLTPSHKSSVSVETRYAVAMGNTVYDNSVEDVPVVKQYLENAYGEEIGVDELQDYWDYSREDDFDEKMNQAEDAIIDGYYQSMHMHPKAELLDAASSTAVYSRNQACDKNKAQPNYSKIVLDYIHDELEPIQFGASNAEEPPLEELEMLWRGETTTSRAPSYEPHHAVLDAMFTCAKHQIQTEETHIKRVSKSALFVLNYLSQ